MPYIPPDTRKRLVPESDSPATTPGELNFQITMLVKQYLGDDINYFQLNEVIGVLECAKHELYRRIIAIYEENKKEAHGDVY